MTDLILDALATARLARLVTMDSLPPLAQARDELHARIASRHGIEWANGLRCCWCVGAWCAAGVVLARRFAPRAWRPVGKALAFSQVAGLLGSLDA